MHGVHEGLDLIGSIKFCTGFFNDLFPFLVFLLHKVSKLLWRAASDLIANAAKAVFECAGVDGLIDRLIEFVDDVFGNASRTKNTYPRGRSKGQHSIR